MGSDYNKTRQTGFQVTGVMDGIKSEVKYPTNIFKHEPCWSSDFYRSLFCLWTLIELPVDSKFASLVLQ